MCDTVRIIYPDGRVSVVELAFSQLSALLRDVEIPPEFWSGDVSIDTPNGNVKIVDMERLKRGG